MRVSQMGPQMLSSRNAVCRIDVGSILYRLRISGLSQLRFEVHLHAISPEFGGDSGRLWPPGPDETRARPITWFVGDVALPSVAPAPDTIPSPDAIPSLVSLESGDISCFTF
eukprot:m.413985 g.413985  ORF g.413985 m.413985 type:complete len:112 (-) comp16823_c0_seq35:993-1328(-)